MCGIFGLSFVNRPDISSSVLKATMDDLFVLSESRGKEAAGLAIYNQETIDVYKDAVSASGFVRRDLYAKLLEGIIDQKKNGGPVALIGHSRLVTNGSMAVHVNNQPVITQGLVGIHNGIIVNDEELWQAFPSLNRKCEVDTEVILALIHHLYTKTGSLIESLRTTFRLIKGTASIAVLFADLNVLILATNNGSLYTCTNSERSAHVFASEHYILQMLSKRPNVRKIMGCPEIRQVCPRSGYIIDILTAKAEVFSLDGEDIPGHVEVKNIPPKKILDLAVGKEPSLQHVSPPAPVIIPESVLHRYDIDIRPIAALRRCTKCLLPETVPFIDFDDKGVCNYCRCHRQISVHGKDALMKAIEPYRSKSGRVDCLVTFSGGRDSSYGVHYVKSILKMNPVTYTYDWGMVTDLARRNQARICGKLGIEHILVSADINKKRSNIRKNVIAWLKKPDLGTVPLFMAGDKQYFYYANKLRKQIGTDLVFICINPFERTNFKTGFCGVKQSLDSVSNYALSLTNQIRLAFYYGKQYLLNPAYINDSLLDTFGAFISFYMIPHNYLNLFHYIMWDEEEINTTLIREYDWEVAGDTRTTWRIGDGTASFYNYIYYCVAGFTENDTFRSNQIRQGMISREQAVETIYNENKPRFESMQWYCNTIGIDMEAALKRINEIPKLYGPARSPK